MLFYRATYGRDPEPCVGESEQVCKLGVELSRTEKGVHDLFAAGSQSLLWRVHSFSALKHVLHNSAAAGDSHLLS